jgi:RHS repeat-associated protein
MTPANELPQAPKGDEGADQRFRAPVVSLPKGGGAIRGIGEKFAANPVTGTASITIPLPLSPGRSGFTPALALQYDSGSGNGPYGYGWTTGYSSITRRTDRGLPQYFDTRESDVYLISGAEDLVPETTKDGTRFEELRDGYRITRYRPRIEGLFSRIERWTNVTSPADTFWRSISRDNITSFYGRTPESRITDPADPARIFTWLFSESFDDKGNAMAFEYIAEDGRGVDLPIASEAGRTDANRSSNRYLKRVKYGNVQSRFIQADPTAMQWLFELVMDYGDHMGDIPGPDPTAAWAVRPDPFSFYRSGFEIRTYRRCQRILMFHRFMELGPVATLVRCLTLDYDDYAYPAGAGASEELAYTGSTRLGSLLRRATLTGFAADGTAKSMPPLEFTYTQARIGEKALRLTDESYENLPAGVDGSRYHWVDVNGEGLNGVLREEGDAWWYKPNLGQGRLGAQQLIAKKPSFGLESYIHFADLAGDGHPDLVQYSRPNAGFFERDDADGWQTFRPFRSQPNLQWDDSNLRFVDLTGDGHADVLITEDDVFHWHRALGEEGFGPRQSVRMGSDENAGPRLVFHDTTEAIFLADMSGDGMSDLVRIRCAEVCYWPNLGYGHFGAKLTMDNAPVLDQPEMFEPRRIRLADIDGSGTVDLIYLAQDGVRLYFNRSGNSWSEPYRLAGFPPVENVAAIDVVDLLGNGTACLVWSSPLPGAAGAPLRYLDLMGGNKPRLLAGIENNMGARTLIGYAPSTRYYLEDQLAGRPWGTRLPFPVHVVELTEVFDDISRNRFVSRFAYHDGYFDGVEREFRGFGMVERWDTEEFSDLNADQELHPAANIDAASHVPPVLTRTRFHTGDWRASDHAATLPESLTAQEEREAFRALKGAMLRQEVYALDGSAKQANPYSVAEQTYSVRLVQSRGANRHGVFFTHARESVGSHYERNSDDARVAHDLTLETDEFGNVLKSASVVYGREQTDPALKSDDQARQQEIHISYMENEFTNAVDQTDAYRTPASSASRTYELTGLALPAGRARFTPDDLIADRAAAVSIAYEATPSPGILQKRLIEQSRTLYRRDDLSDGLPLGQMQSMALPFETYRHAFTRGLITQIYGAKVTDTMLAEDGRYVHSEGDNEWWIPSGRVFLSPGATDDAATEFANARQHFFVARRYADPFGQTAAVDWDSHDLLVAETRDPLNNAVRASQVDYRVLKPSLIVDPNGNRTAVSFDALQMVVGIALMGKADENPRRGDQLDGFVANLPDDVVAAHLENPLTDPHSILGRATSRVVYDVSGYYRTKQQAQPSPTAVYTIARETHDADLAPGQQTKVQHSFTYSDGFGREIQKKLQAEPGPSGPRWVGTGWTVFNNKGNPVRQFEPFFADSQAFESDVRAGVSPVLFYDPTGRVIGTLHPNHTWEKVVFDAWRQENWDVNDTALIADPKSDPDVRDFFARLPDTDYLPTWFAQRLGGALGPDEQAAATKTAVHSGTPSVSHSDSLGRTFLTIAHNKSQRSNEQSPTEEFFANRIVFDIEGNQREVMDESDRLVMRYDYDLLGNRIHQASMEAGERWMLSNIAGKPIYAWDSRDHQFHTTYDDLQRPASSLLREGTGPERVIGRTVYGESQLNPEANNQRGRVVQVFDQAGVATTADYDFKGNLLANRRQLAQEYKRTLDWSGAVPLEPETHSSSSSFDALNRPTEQITPNGTRIRHTFNEANLLESLAANLRGESAVTTFIRNIDYDAKGLRTLVEYGNGVTTAYDYDPQTFRLSRRFTRREANVFPSDCPQPPLTGSPGCGVQDLNYAYDPAGNITAVRDGAQQTIYFRNRRVDPGNVYAYDATYRLIEATGREHLGQGGGQPNALSPPDPFDALRTRLDHPGDGNALGTYVERYFYDPDGNFLSLRHQGSDPAQAGWIRTYSYNEASQLEPDRKNNRLTSVSIGGTTETYHYDGSAGLHGNITAMPHLPSMQWDFRDMLQAMARQVVGDGTAGTTWYVYDAAGQRIRKVTERQSGTRANERIYLSGFEIYRELGPGSAEVTLERETLHMMDDTERVALIEMRTQGTDGSPARLIRYQFGNRIDSVALELDDLAQIISYEEYYPHGDTSYQAVGSQTETPKRYRYSGRERDEESGFSYHVARYYAPWLGRWTSCDPIGIKSGLNLYVYCHNNSIVFSDPGGRDSPPDAVVKSGNRGTVFYYTETLHRENLYSRLERTYNPATGQGTQKLYRRSEGSGWVDVTQDALRDDMRHNKPTPTTELTVDWNMPTLETDEDKVRKIEGPGLMWGFALFVVRDIQGAYLKDQTIGIKDPYLRLRASTKQQAFKALDEANQKLEEFALTSIVPELPGAVGGLGRATTAARALRAGTELEEGGKATVTLYRGVNQSHVDFAAQSQGLVRPNKRWWQFWKTASTPIEHNAAMGGTLSSEFTSWTTDIRVAENFARRPGDTAGAIITAEVRISKTVVSPNTKEVVLIMTGELVSEAEVLVKGVVRGIARLVSP